MDDCIFCKIARDEVPSRKVHHESGEIISFLDIHPAAPGHTLVVPVKHYRWFYEMPDDLVEKIFRTASHIAQKLKEEHSADFVRLSVVGTDVPHVHIHLVPQKFSDSVRPL